MAYWNVSTTRGGGAPGAASPSLSASTRRTQARAGAKSLTRDGCSVSATRLRRRRRHTGP